MGDQTKEQEARTKKALEGLEVGTITICPQSPSSWIVQNGDHQPYTVKRENLGWSCNCLDFQNKNGYGLLCKHIEAVKINQSSINDTTKEKQMANSNLVGYVELFHPAYGGISCKLPLPLNATLTPDQAKAMFESVNRLLATGFMANQPGLEEGEKKERVTHIARRQKFNQDDQSTTPIIDIYCGGNFKITYVYLNKPEDVALFETTFNRKLDSLPLWEGDAAIERGKNPGRDAKYILSSIKSNIWAVYKNNPKWEGDDDTKHTKRVFVRWEVQGVTVQEPAPQTKSEALPGDPTKQTPPTHMDVNKSMAATGFGQSPVRKYGDGAVCSSNPAEQSNFDNYVSIYGKPAKSIAELREFAAAQKA
jgi:hypothetical protein